MSQRDWSYWYSLALEYGFTPEQAERYADKKMKEVK